MRGEDGTSPSDRGRGGGITPACAGKTVAIYIGNGRMMDHPRMRGEDAFI